jgi:serine/threonine protein kinase
MFGDRELRQPFVRRLHVDPTAREEVMIRVFSRPQMRSVQLEKSRFGVVSRGLGVGSRSVTPEASTAVPSLVGQCIDGRLRIEARIDSGGGSDSGSMFRAQHLALQRPVALKFLLGDAGATFRRSQFEREALAIARLEHPHIASVLDWGVYSGRLYVASEWLEGETLAERLRRSTPSFSESQAIARQLLAALSAAHVAGLAHRNLKPENVFLQRREHGDPRVKLLDFGLSPALPKPAPRASAPAGSPLAAQHFVAPEQRAGEAPDARSDVYAAGEILAAMLGGHGRARASSTSDTWLVAQRLHVANEPSGLTRASGSAAAAQLHAAQRRSSFMVERSAALLGLDRGAGLQSVVERARARQPSERYADAAQMLAELIDRLPREQRAASESTPARAHLSTESTESTEATDLALGRNGAAPTALETRDAASDTADTDGAVAAIDVDSVAALPLALLRDATQAANGNALAPARSPAAALRPERVRTRTWLGTESLIVAGLVLLGAASVMLVLAWRGSESAGHDPVAGAHPATSQSAEATRPVPSPAHRETRVDALSTPPTKPELVRDERPAAPAPVSAYEAAAQLPVPFRSQRSPEAQNPWLEPLPAALVGVHDIVARGGHGDELLLQKLRSYNLIHANDPRGCILLGGIYLNRMWRSDAIQQFALAIERDRSARGAPELLPRLLRLVMLGKATAEAQRVIVQHYGLEALPAIDAALAEVTSAATATRLHDLAAEISVPSTAPERARAR